MKHSALLTLAFLLVLSCLAVSAPARASEEKVKVYVTTKDPYTDQPVGSVLLDFWKVEPVDHGTFEECVKTAKTDASGKKTVSLAPGNYQINVSDAPDGYATFSTTEVTVTGKGRMTVDVLPLLTCKVKVIDQWGKTVPGALVTICGASARTDKNGRATVSGVEYGQRNVEVRVGERGKEYIAYDKTLSFKGRANQKISKTIRLLPRLRWIRYETLIVEKKPIIYLYSRDEKNVNVRLGRPENLLASYPAYAPEKGWNVTVHPDGLLTDRESGRTLYSLFWEGINEKGSRQETGFVVSGRDTAAFLEEKLAYLGLNEREAEEFIVFWLPQMQQNAWNYIRFATPEEIEACMPLIITPRPDHVLRVWMAFSALEEKIDIPEQQLERTDRNLLDSGDDFYAVEWGGMEF